MYNQCIMTIIHRHIGTGLSYYQYRKDNIFSHKFYWTRGDGGGRLDALRMARQFRKCMIDSKKWSITTWRHARKFRRTQCLNHLRFSNNPIQLSCILDFDIYS